MHGQLTLNVPHVVHETIDGETILIHLGTGTYYSLDGAGAEVWELVLDGVPAGEVSDRLKGRHRDADPALVEQTVGALLGELVQEELLRPAEANGAAAAASAALQSVSDPPAAEPFSPPVLRKYTDMQEFMLVDPLHDVEADAGWPHVKAG